MIIPGFIISILTFPGVIVHEMAHRFFCDVAGVRVFKVCYFRVGNPAGYVLHENTSRLGASFLITIGPLIVNTVLCSVLTFMPVIAFSLETAYVHPVFYLLGWVGLSMGMHAFPSNQDAANFVAVVNATGKRGLLYWVSKGFRGLIFVANLLRIVWFDLIYAGLVAWVFRTCCCTRLGLGILEVASGGFVASEGDGEECIGRRNDQGCGERSRRHPRPWRDSSGWVSILRTDTSEARCEAPGKERVWMGPLLGVGAPE
jgi:hypothetical protein